MTHAVFFSSLMRALLSDVLRLVAVVGTAFSLLACSGEASMGNALGGKVASGKPSVSIKIDQALLKDGRVVLHSKIQNTGQDPLVFLPWGTPFDSKVTREFLTVHPQSNTEVAPLPYTGRMFKRAAPQRDDYLRLSHNQTHENSLEITSAYDFCSDQTYLVTYQGPLILEDFAEATITKVSLTFVTEAAFPPC